MISILEIIYVIGVLVHSIYALKEGVDNVLDAGWKTLLAFFAIVFALVCIFHLLHYI